MSKSRNNTARKIPPWLLEKTFVIQHNPNCPKPFLVRLVCPGTGKLDLLPYYAIGNEQITKDALGFGHSVEEAAEAARNQFPQPKGREILLE